MSVEGRPGLGPINEDDGGYLTKRQMRLVKEQQQWGTRSRAAAALRHVAFRRHPTFIVVRVSYRRQPSITFYSPPICPRLLSRLFSAESFLIVLFNDVSLGVVY